MKKTYVFIGLLLIASFALPLYFYQDMPQLIATHWDINGNVNGHMPKLEGLFFVPVLLLVLVGVFLLIPKIDPLKKNIEKFRKYYDGFIFVLVLFMFYVHVLTLLLNLDYNIDLIRFMIPAFSVLLFYLGVMMQNAKQNWFIGIRTPWTLSNEHVWDSTHRMAGKAYKIAAVISLAGVLSGRYALYFFIAPMVAVSLYSVVYSYLEWKKVSAKK
jgi:uncharacterized membrane protein